MSKLEAALFYLFDSGVLVGALVAHVDDLYSTGTGKKHEECLKFLGKEIYFKRKVGDFRYCGKNVKTEQRRISLSGPDRCDRKFGVIT